MTPASATPVATASAPTSTVAGFTLVDARVSPQHAYVAGRPGWDRPSHRCARACRVRSHIYPIRGRHADRGRRIGSIGATGNARTTGCHLHLEIRSRAVPIDSKPELHA